MIASRRRIPGPRGWVVALGLCTAAVAGCADDGGAAPPAPTSIATPPLTAPVSGPGASSGGAGGAAGAAGTSGGSTPDATATAADARSETAPPSPPGTGGAGGSGTDATSVDSSARDAGGATSDSAPPADGATRSGGRYTCSQYMGVSTNGAWYMGGGFEKHVDPARWQILWKKHGFFGTWGPGGSSWSGATLESPCASGSSTPDHVVFTGVDYGESNESAWVSGLVKVVDALKARYSNLRRIDLTTPIRAPGNKPCNGSTSSENYIYPAVDVAIAKVAAMFPGLVFATPIFYAEGCAWFTSGGDDKLSPAGEAAAAKLVAMYFAGIE